MSTRLKRPATVLAYWRKEKLICENYRTKSCTEINASTFAILDYFGEWRSHLDCSQQFPGHPKLRLFRFLEELVTRQLLVREGSPEAAADELCQEAWAWWLPEAGFLHFGTRDIKYASNPEEARKIIEDLLRLKPQPPFFKTYSQAPVVVLPPATLLEADFQRVLLKRRTHRRFSPEPISLEHLSTLLQYTWGVTGFSDDPLLGRLPQKTSPSGGARHPEEVYVVALRVEGLRPGLYHYSSDRHLLECLQFEPDSEGVIAYCAGQRWIGCAAALFIMTMVLARTMWKYPVPRGYRVALTESGHLCQTFLLVACALELGSFCTMALNESLIEKDLDLKSFEETIMYVAGVGVPLTSSCS